VAALLGGGALGLCVVFVPGCAYLAQAARGQLQLMAGRMPVAEALAEVDLTDSERDRLELVGRVKSFGEDVIGLSPTKNYDTINPTFDQVVWNVSGTAPDRFEPHQYAYPVVGKLPYIGFFERSAADEEAALLESLGWETYVRSAGAYSTLGWFRDPLWRSMLAWDVEQLSNTVLHELAHATVWLPGHGSFNESLATFLGDQAAARFMESIRAERPEAYTVWQDREHDGALYKEAMHELVARLDGLYQSGLPRGEVLARKAQVIAEARSRWGTLPWRIEGYRRALDEDRTVNNARLVQFRVYNTGSVAFEEALARFGGDLPAFIEAARTLESARRRGGADWDPYEALERIAP
jgi:predicted aminopeptidase